MFGKFKGKIDKGGNAAPSFEGAATAPEPSETISSIGYGMTIVGKIVGDGVLEIFGRFEGELRAATVLIGEGAHVEGKVIAQELTIGGRVKGTIHAIRVTLHGAAVVEGDIFHQSLSIEGTARFEGSSRRENPTDTSSNVRLKGSNLQIPTQPPVASIEGVRKFKSPPDNVIDWASASFT
jgi:cytoskeletal protein CcmA (bactofilin family)